MRTPPNTFKQALAEPGAVSRLTGIAHLRGHDGRPLAVVAYAWQRHCG